MMKKTFLALTIMGLATAVILFGWLLSPTETNANPSRVTRCSTFATTGETHATTSPSYMRAGTGTTTLACPTDGAYDFDVRVMLKASSTKTNLRGYVAHSDNGTDWYPVSVPLTSNATTTTYSGSPNELSIHYASTTPEDSGGNADTMWATLKFRDVAARYTRVRFYLPPGSLNGAVYAEMVKKEQHR